MKGIYSALHRFAQRTVIQPAIDFVYSPICFHCQNPVRSGEYLCDECSEWLTPIEFESEIHRSLRNEILSNTKYVSDVYALYEFMPGGVLQTLIHDLKYQQKTRIGFDLGKELGRSIQHIYSIDDTWLLVPIPLHPSRERQRGYNQAFYIALGISEITGSPVASDMVYRVRNTRTQTKLTLDERKENISAAFEYDKKRIEGEPAQIAIVDDVITTGATIGEVASVLPRTGSLYAFSLAHSPINA